MALLLPRVLSVALWLAPLLVVVWVGGVGCGADAGVEEGGWPPACTGGNTDCVAGVASGGVAGSFAFWFWCIGAGGGVDGDGADRGGRGSRTWWGIFRW